VSDKLNPRWENSYGFHHLRPDQQDAIIELTPYPHKMVCPECGLTRHLPDGWQKMLNSETIKCRKDDAVMVEEEE